MYRILVALFFLCATVFYLVRSNPAVIASEEAGVKLPPKLLAFHTKSSNCLSLNDPNMPPVDKIFHARLDQNNEVYGILCEPSAYNWPYAIYLVRDGYTGEAERLLFADYSQSGGWTGTDLLYNAVYDANSHELKGFSKARGLGDCGSLIILKWHEDQFALAEFRYKDECDGDASTPFPLIYKRFSGKP